MFLLNPVQKPNIHQTNNRHIYKTTSYSQRFGSWERCERAHLECLQDLRTATSFCPLWHHRRTVPQGRLKWVSFVAALLLDQVVQEGPAAAPRWPNAGAAGTPRGRQGRGSWALWGLNSCSSRLEKEDKVWEVVIAFIVNGHLKQ